MSAFNRGKVKASRRNKPVVREVSFDALTMQTARDIKCKGPVLNMGDALLNWKIWVNVRSLTPEDYAKLGTDQEGEVKIKEDKFYFSTQEPVALRQLHPVIKSELAKREIVVGELVKNILVTARIV